MSTVTKTNMCAKEFRGLMSFCKAQKIENQEDCTHYIKHSYLNRCMFYRKDIGGACDNQWAQRKEDMPEEVIKAYEEWSR